MSRTNRKQSSTGSRRDERRSKNRSERRDVKYSLSQGEYDQIPQVTPIERPKKFETLDTDSR